MAKQKLSPDKIPNIVQSIQSSNSIATDKDVLTEFIGKKTISYSQLTMFLTCPYSWKLKYIDKIKIDKPSIHLVFGTSMHVLLQNYIKELYLNKELLAEDIDVSDQLVTIMVEEYKKTKTQTNISFSSSDELKLFHKQGLDIYNFIKKHRSDYFPLSNCELVGIELPLLVEVDGNENVLFLAYIDYALYSPVDNMIFLKDIKTSTNGWDDAQKSDASKIAQLNLYKKYFSKQYKIPLDNIDTEYFIVKRIIKEDAMFPQKRVQLFSPASGKVSLNKSERDMTRFVTTAFDRDGNYNIDVEYDKALNSSCSWCQYRGTAHCKDTVCEPMTF